VFMLFSLAEPNVCVADPARDQALGAVVGFMIGSVHPGDFSGTPQSTTSWLMLTRLIKMLCHFLSWKGQVAMSAEYRPELAVFGFVLGKLDSRQNLAAPKTTHTVAHVASL